MLDYWPACLLGFLQAALIAGLLSCWVLLECWVAWQFGIQLADMVSVSFSCTVAITTHRCLLHPSLEATGTR